MSQVKDSVRKEASAAFDALRKLAADYERIRPGAGEAFLRQVTDQLRLMHEQETNGLGQRAFQLSRIPERSAA